MPETAQPLYYFHGFNSAIPGDISESPKILETADYARRRGLQFLPQTIDYREAAFHAEEIVSMATCHGGEILFCGASLGGWFARVLQLLLLRASPGQPATAVVFNPAFDLALHGHMLIGRQVNYVTAEQYHWTALHSRRLAELERMVDYDLDLPFHVFPLGQQPGRIRVLNCRASRRGD